MRTDRREHPRIKTSLPLDIIMANGEVLQGILIDISRAGLQISCDGPTAHRIFPEGYMLSAGKFGKVQVRCSLGPGDQSAGNVDAACRLVFSRRVAQDKYCIGLQFEEFAGDSYSAIEQYIEEHLV